MKRLLSIGLIFIIVLSASGQETSDAMPQFFYTHHQLDGNRFVEGSGNFPDVTTFDFDLEAVPVWAVAFVDESGALQVDVADSNGLVWRITPQTGAAAEVTRLQPGTPFLRALDTALGAQIAAVTPQTMRFSHPVVVGEDVLYIAQNGDLVLVRAGEEVDRVALNMQDDGRISVNASGQIAVYADATDQRYIHGIMGDNHEGAALVVLEIVDDSLRQITRVDLPGEMIYEGLAPMWADINEDGTLDIITTISDSREGSGIRAYLFDGERFTLEVNGPRIGTGFRWQHQLAWGPFGMNGAMQLVDVRTPHIGGIVRFYNFTGDALEIESELAGYTSHLIHSRNLDMAVAGDFNGDGTPEIALPRQDRLTIAGIQNSANGAQNVWELPLEGRLSTNLSAVQTANGLALVAGTEDGRLRVWLR